MGLRTFKGGIHPWDGKSLSREQQIVPLKPGKELIFLVSQHIGAPAVPVVKKGDRVLAGQMIAQAGGFVSAPVFSSVSGVVKGIESCLTATGGTCDGILVENDEAYETVEFSPVSDYSVLSKDDIRKKIQEAGVVGMGGAGFPTHVKLSPKEPENIDYILVNGAECEPYLTSDYRRMLEEPEKLIGGLKVILQLFDHAKGCICIEDNKPECIEKISRLVAEEPRIEVRPLKTKYPQGAERMLIYAVTGRCINSSMLPADAGCVVDNVDTVVAVYKAVVEGRPLMHRIVTVTGDAVKKPSNFSVPVGMKFTEVLEAAGGLKGEVEKIISGGPMMGFAMFDLNVPVTKTTSALLCLTRDEVSHSETTACINCGKCVSACPENLLPSRLATFAEHKDESRFLKYNGMECCECGCCSYVCPAKRMLAQKIKSMRKIVLANRKKK